MKFYDIKGKKPMEVKKKQISLKKTSNGNILAVADTKHGKLYKFLSKEQAKKF